MARLAMRHEGDNWNAYYALPSSMENAILLGSIKMKAVAEHPERRDAFLSLMQDVVSDLIEEAVGIRPSWDDQKPAPEHERSGHS